MLERVRALAASGLAVVLSTHDPDHAFLCADRVALLHRGRLVALGTPEETVTPENPRLLYGVDAPWRSCPRSAGASARRRAHPSRKPEGDPA